jgi:hypothetical protein
MATKKPESKRKVGGGKLARSETVTVRLDPKLRYLAELAALKQRRTVSSFIEWAIEDTLSRECIQESANLNDRDITFSDVASELWDVDDADRFVKLALNYPDLLTHEEQKRWKLIRENGHLWKGLHDKLSGEWSWTVQESSLIFERLRDHWATFTAVAQGETDRSALPKWPKTKSTPTVIDGVDDTGVAPF